METKKSKKAAFIKNKKVTRIDDIDVNKILVFKQEPYGTKIHLNTLLDMLFYRIWYVIRPLCIKLSQMSGYVRKFEGNTTMSFKIGNKQFLKSIIKYGKELKNYWK